MSSGAGATALVAHSAGRGCRTGSRSGRRRRSTASRSAVGLARSRRLCRAPTNDEVDFARSYLIGAMPFRRDRARQRMQLAVRDAVFDLPVGYTAQLPEALRALSAADVRAACGRHLQPDDAVTVAVMGHHRRERTSRSRDRECGPDHDRPARRVLICWPPRDDRGSESKPEAASDVALADALPPIIDRFVREDKRVRARQLFVPRPTSVEWRDLIAMLDTWRGGPTPMSMLSAMARDTWRVPRRSDAYSVDTKTALGLYVPKTDALFVAYGIFAPSSGRRSARRYCSHEMGGDGGLATARVYLRRATGASEQRRHVRRAWGHHFAALEARGLEIYGEAAGDGSRSR